MIPRVLTALLLLLVSVSPARAIQFAHRVLDESDGVPPTQVFGLGQDVTGYLWMATNTGVARYDGVRLRYWTQRPPRDLLGEVVTGPEGEVLVLDEAGALTQVAGDSMAPVIGPDGGALSSVTAAAFGHDGALWIARGNALHVRRRGVWSAPPGPSGNVRIYDILPDDSRGALVADTAGVHRIYPDLPPELVASAPRALKLLPLEDGAVAVLRWATADGVLLKWSRGKIVELGIAPGRPIDMALRGETIWVSSDRYLTAFRRGGPPQVMGPKDGLPAGGPLLVDREGSLWLGTFEGPLQFPEPDTILLNESDGLPSSHTRFLNRTAEGLWLSTWQGSARIREDRRGITAEPLPARGIGRNCVDARGVLWYSRTDWVVGDFALLERRESSEVEHRPEGFWWMIDCAPVSDGGLWIATNNALLKSAPAGGLPVRVTEPALAADPDNSIESRRVLEDSSGRLWLSRGRSICHADARLTRMSEDAWTCQAVKSMRHVTQFAEPAPGVLWAATAGGGVLRHRGESWEPIPGSRELPSAEVFGLRNSPAGGVWVLSFESILRVAARSDSGAGWEKLEELTRWHGIPGGHREDVLEEADGTLWITTGFGVARVPPGARRPPRVPPRVELAELIVDDRHLPPDTSFRLPYHRNRLELHFAALSYRDPGLLRYRIRTGGDGSWSRPFESPFVRLVDLSPGRHRMEVSASLDGLQWSPAPARLEFRVGRPWYLQAWFFGLCALLVGTAAYTVHRARVASLLRLERQRARIAMDLHDEMGSGLGSIGILAELAAGNRVDEERRRTLSMRIAETAGELGSALDEIVWSLRPGAGTIQELAAELAERGRDLFPDGKASFQALFPAAWPLVRLSPAVRRNLQRIAVEAMHNAARHSGAGSVTLGLAPHGRRWRLWVADDGKGMPPEAEISGNGLGLSGMRRRAEEIGAALALESAPGGGTTLTLEFDPAAPHTKARLAEIP